MDATQTLRHERNAYDAQTYTERRAQAADAAEGRLDAVIGQNFRRQQAIVRAVTILSQMVTTEIMRNDLRVRLNALLLSLSRANETRVEDHPLHVQPALHITLFEEAL